MNIDGAMGSFGGLRVMTVEHWPKVSDGTTRLPAHPLILWLARWLPLRTWWAEVQNYRDSDPIIHEAAGVLYCSPRQYAELRTALMAMRR